MPIVTWCNDNQGFIMSLLTTVYVLATIVIAMIARHTNAISRKNLDVLTQLEVERTRPLVCVSLRNEAPFVLMTISNTGQTPAYNVRIATEPELKLFLGGKTAMPKEKSQHTLGVIEHGIGTLGAGVSEEVLIGSFSRFCEEYPEMRFSGTVTYNTPDGRQYITPVNVDMRYMKDALHIDRKTVHDIAKTLDDIHGKLSHFMSGHSVPHIVTEDIEHKRAADAALMKQFTDRADKESAPASA